MVEEKIEAQESPEYLRTSLAAAITLDLKRGWFYRRAELHCINLLLTYAEGCIGNCSYCGLSRYRGGAYADRSFIRVEWPTYKLDDLITRIGERSRWVQRICISMITNRRAVEDTVTVIARIRERLDTSVSILATPTVLKRDDLERYRQIGADRMGIAIDAATEELFETHRGRGVRGPHFWTHYWRVFEEAVEVFGERRVGAHLIVGLGETEEEMVRAIQHVRDQGGCTHLFSFFPEPGSKMDQDGMEPPPIGHYRRIQLARYLMDEGLCRAGEMTFDGEGRIRSFGLPEERVDEIITWGKPFMTSGCPDNETGEVACTRPFGNSPPGPNVRNFPFDPDEEDLARIRTHLRSYE